MFELSAKREGPLRSLPSVKILSVLMLVALVTVVCCFVVLNESSPSEADGETSGQCGDDLYWSYDDQTGALTITGTGAMYNYEMSDKRWGGNKISSVSMPDGLTHIGNNAFLGSTSLTSITIPVSVASIGDDAFLGCTSIASITVDENNSVYSSENGIMFNKSKTELILCPAGKKDASIVIPDSVTSIGDNAFSYCASLQSVTIPDSVTSIGLGAFLFCTSLTSVIIPDSVSSIGMSVFYGCNSLASVTISDSITTIAYQAFSRCTSLTSVAIPDSVIIIDENAFWGCTSLASITIPDSVTSIGNKAFANCTSMLSITISPDCSGINENAFPSHTFYEEDETTVITSRGEGFVGYTFGGGSVDKMIRNGVPPVITHHVTYDIDGGSGEAPVQADVQEGSTFIAAEYNGTKTGHTFGGWSYGGKTYQPGAEIVMGKSDITLTAVWALNKYTVRFLNDDSTVLQSEKLDYGSTPIYSGETPTKKPTPQYIYTFSGWDPAISAVTCDADYTAQYTSKTVGGQCGDDLYWTYDDQTGALTIIGTGAMYDYEMSDKRWGGYKISSVSMPDGLTHIGKNAFLGSTSLTTITIPVSVSSIGDDAFLGSTSLASITVDENNSVYSSENGIMFNKSKTELILCPAGKKDVSIAIPDSVTIIGDNAFSYCASLQSVTIPDSVTSIGVGAFLFCTSLQSIVIPDSVTSIGMSVFYGCNSLTSATIPDSITIIVSQAFSRCSSLASITIPDSVTTIAENAFWGCSSLGSITIPDSVTTIGGNAFANCTSMLSITISPECSGIDSNAFPSHTFYAKDGITEITSRGKGFVGYTFIGESADKMIRQYNPMITHHVTYDIDGGSGEAPVQADVHEGSTFAAAEYDGTKAGYTFDGWSYGGETYQPGAEIFMSDSDITLKAIWTLNKYTVRFLNDDGTVLQSEELDYGSTPVYSGETPTKAPTAQYTYSFSGWSPGVVMVTGAADYTAQYTETVNKYTIKFLNYDDTVLQSEELDYGSTPVYSGETPTKAPTAQYTYSFNGWSPEVVIVTGEADYTAQYTSVLNKYTVRFLNDDGTVLQSEELDYGSTPVYSGGIPTKESDVYHTYEFSGWGPEIKVVTEDAEYTAVYKTLDRKYTLSFDVDGGSVPLDDVIVTAGDEYILPGYPGVKKAMAFDGWLYGSVKYSSGDPVTVLSDMSFKAAWADKPKHSVTYELDGGSGVAPIQEDVIEDLTFTVKSYDGTKAGYTFGGWSYSGKTYQPGAEVTMGTSDITFTAVWNEKPKHHVTYDVNGGSGSAPVQADVAEGLSFIVKEYDGTKAGFVFQSWSYNGLAFKVGNEIVMGTTDIVLKAVWISDGKEAVIEVDDDNVPLTSDTVKELKDKAVADPESTAVFELDSATVKFDNVALKSLDGTKSATLAAKTIPDSELPESVKKIVAGGTVIDMSFGVNKNFNDGKVTITVPFVLAEGKSADDLKVYFIENGQIKETVDGTYDNGFMTFTVSHFSMYGIAYTEPKPAPAPADSGNSMFIIIGAVVAIIVVAAIAVFIVKRKQ